jgi:hypothetical protein
MFATVFLRYNKTHFYKDNDLWDNFELRIGVKRISMDLRNGLIKQATNGKLSRSKEIEMKENIEN